MKSAADTLLETMENISVDVETLSQLVENEINQATTEGKTSCTYYGTKEYNSTVMALLMDKMSDLGYGVTENKGSHLNEYYHNLYITWN